MDAARETRGEIERRFAETARKMYFSKESISRFTQEATYGQLAAVCGLVDHERAMREADRKARLFRQARFPQVKSLEGYDFSNAAFPDGRTKEDLCSLDFVERAQDLVFFGSCGLGKTHLAVALGKPCTQNGYVVRYCQTAGLVLQLRAANAAEKLEPMLKDIRNADLLILDEFGYIPTDSEGAYLLCQAMAQTYESKGLVVTTNIEFSKWGAVLADEKLAKATVDRIVRHGRLIEFSGQSKRLDNSLMMSRTAQ